MSGDERREVKRVEVPGWSPEEVETILEAMAPLGLVQMIGRDREGHMTYAMTEAGHQQLEDLSDETQEAVLRALEQVREPEDEDGPDPA